MRFLLLLTMLATWPSLALAQPEAPSALEISDCSRPLAAGGRVLCHEAVLPAPVTDVWALFATTEGLRSWLAPVAAIDLRIGGIWETSYDPEARLGDSGNIRNRVLSFLPERMLSIQVAQAPPGFPHADTAVRLWTVIEFEPAGAGATRVRVSMLGYGRSEADDVLYRFFDRGNAYTLQKLAQRIAEGPTDWSAQR